MKKPHNILTAIAVLLATGGAASAPVSVVEPVSPPKISITAPAAPWRGGGRRPASGSSPHVVPFPPGGGTDTIARETSQRVATAPGWTFAIDNRPGSGGSPAVDAVAKSPADGYTLVLGQTSNLAINPTLYAKMPYEPQRDLAPIVLVASAPLVMVTGVGTPYKTLAEAVNAARAKPGALNFASPGNGTGAHLTRELFQKTAGVNTQHVPCKGAAQALTDVMSGTVELPMSSVPC